MSGPPLGACAGRSPRSVLLPVLRDRPGGLGRGGVSGRCFQVRRWRREIWV